MMYPDLDPQPGDFDEEFQKIDPADVQVVEASRDRHLVLQVTLDGDDAAALQRIAHQIAPRGAFGSGATEISRTSAISVFAESLWHGLSAEAAARRRPALRRVPEHRTRGTRARGGRFSSRDT